METKEMTTTGKATGMDNKQAWQLIVLLINDALKILMRSTWCFPHGDMESIIEPPCHDEHHPG